MIIPDLSQGSIGKLNRPKVKDIDYYQRFYEKITPNNFQHNIIIKKLLKPFEWCVNYEIM